MGVGPRPTPYIWYLGADAQMYRELTPRWRR